MRRSGAKGLRNVREFYSALTVDSGHPGNVFLPESFVTVHVCASLASFQLCATEILVFTDRIGAVVADFHDC